MRIDDENHQHLLEMRTIADDARQTRRTSRRMVTRRCSASPAVSLEHMVDGLGDIHRHRLEFAPVHQRANAADGGIGAQVVLTNVGEDICLSSSSGGFSERSMISAASALLRIAHSGWLTSCATMAVSSPTTAKRAACASCRPDSSARLRSVMS